MSVGVAFRGNSELRSRCWCLHAAPQPLPALRHPNICSLALSQRLHAAFKNELQILNETDFLIPGGWAGGAGQGLFRYTAAWLLSCMHGCHFPVSTADTTVLPCLQTKWTGRRPGTRCCATSCPAGCRSCRRSRWAAVEQDKGGMQAWKHASCPTFTPLSNSPFLIPHRRAAGAEERVDVGAGAARAGRGRRRAAAHPGAMGRLHPRVSSSTAASAGPCTCRRLVPPPRPARRPSRPSLPRRRCRRMRRRRPRRQPMRKTPTPTSATAMAIAAPAAGTTPTCLPSCWINISSEWGRGGQGGGAAAAFEAQRSTAQAKGRAGTPSRPC